MELKKHYCEVCWLFADCSLHNFESQRGWINGVATGCNLLGKIKRHENAHMHVQAASVYAAMKARKTLMKRVKNRYERTLVFGLKFSIA